jgi:hypothetical protein
MQTFANAYQAVTGYAYPQHFLPVEELLLSAKGGLRLVLVAPPRFSVSTYLQALVAYRLLARPGEKAFFSAGHGALSPYHTTGPARRARNRICHFATTMGAVSPEERLDSTYVPEPGESGYEWAPNYNLLVVDNPLQITASAITIQHAASEVNSLLKCVLPGGDALLFLQGRQEVAGGDLAHVLSKEGWQVHALPALTAEGPSFPALWPMERLEKVRRDVGETVWRRLYLCEAANPHINPSEAVERIRAIAQQRYACHEANAVANSVRKVLALLKSEPELVLADRAEQ